MLIKNIIIVLKTFPLGGVHPPENKLTADLPIEYLPVPESVIIPVSQHIGSPANPVVNKGDAVRTGQIIAAGKGFISANIHSPVSGKVNKIDFASDSTGYKQTAVFIDVEGDEWLDTIDRSKEIIRDIKLSPEEIVKKMFRIRNRWIRRSYFPFACKAHGTSQGKNVKYLL